MSSKIASNWKEALRNHQKVFFHIILGWMEMKPYYISNYERRVLARFATSEELEIVNTRKLECNIPLFAKKVYDLKKK